MTPGGIYLDLIPATVAIEHLQGAPPGTPVEITEVRFRMDDNDALDQTSPLIIPTDIRTTLAQKVMPSNSAQTVDVTLSAFFSAGVYAIVDAGLPNQEVVQITGVANIDTLAALFQQPHNPGATIMQVAAPVSKTFRVHVKTPPNHSIGKFTLSRRVPLPAGVFDQYQFPNTYATGTSVPWISASGQAFAPVPFADGKEGSAPAVVFSAAALTAAGYSSLFQIQWLLSPFARDQSFPATVYRVGWDEA